MRKYIIITVVTIVCFLTTINSYTQNLIDTTQNKSIHYLGIGAGFTTGVGLMYKYMYNNVGAEVSFLPRKESYDDGYYDMSIHAGFTLLYTLQKSEYTNLFLYQGNYYRYYESSTPYMTGAQKESKNYLNTGIGMGIGITALEHLHWNLMMGWASYNKFEKIHPTIETALFYKF